MLNSSLIGRVLPTGLPCGGTITIIAVSIDKGFVSGLPVITCELAWNTGNPVLDEGTTVGSLAPGTMLWSQLNAAGPVESDPISDANARAAHVAGLARKQAAVQAARD